MKNKIILVFGLLLMNLSILRAQQYNQEYIDSLVKISVQPLISRNTKFIIAGFTGIGIKISKDETSFNNLVLAPILLWKPHEKILVEAELEISLAGGETHIELGYADATFIINNYMNFRAGKFIAPFGIFQDRLHPGWINKLPTVPLGMGEDDLAIGPTSEIGINLLGGIPLGSANLNYSFYLANNPNLVTDVIDPYKQGTLIYGNIDATNNKKTIGGRIGFLPFSSSSLEIGGSFATGKVGDKNTEYKNIGAQQYALDLTYVEQLDFINGLLDIKAQWNFEHIDNIGYPDPTDSTGISAYTFNNKRNSLFAQVAYRPSMSQSKILRKIEIVYRYATLNPPDNPFGPIKTNQYTYGINYWFNWRTVFKAAWQSQKNNNAFFMQVAVGI